MYSSNEFNPPELHPDYDWTDGLRPGSFSTSRTKLGGELFENILQASPEIGIELKRLAKLHYSEVHQHKLRSLIKLVFDTEYLVALNRDAYGTPGWTKIRNDLIEAHKSYAERWYVVNGVPDTARIKREWQEFTVRLAELDAAAASKTDADPDYQYVRSHVHRHCDVIAYWCMADFSRYPECWYHEPTAPAPVVGIWELAQQQAAAEEQEREEERRRLLPVSADKVKHVRNVNKYGRMPAPMLTPAERQEQERLRQIQLEQDRKDEEELQRLIAENERKLAKKQEQIDNNPNIVISVDEYDDLVISAPTTAADLAIKLGHKKKVEVPEFKTTKRVFKVIKKENKQS